MYSPKIKHVATNRYKSRIAVFENPLEEELEGVAPFGLKVYKNSDGSVGKELYVSLDEDMCDLMCALDCELVHLVEKDLIEEDDDTPYELRPLVRYDPSGRYPPRMRLKFTAASKVYDRRGVCTEPEAIAPGQTVRVTVRASHLLEMPRRECGAVVAYTYGVSWEVSECHVV